MLFNSLQFLVFFPIVTLLYFLLPHKYRWVLLLGASCYFYMFFVPYYILILVFTIIIDYYAGILIEKQTSQKSKKNFLLLSLIANIGILAVFKYYNFFIENINSVFHLAESTMSLSTLSIVLPIGLSFHTFQAMSYTIEVYRGNQKAEKHFGIYALYVMFYPQLVAGPIERPQNVLPQLHKHHSFNYDRLISGLRLMMWGIFKKVVIADSFALIVNPFYNNVSDASGWQLLLATYCFTIQIYCDFSGYSDIALGAARIMGIDLMQNFNTPYLSKSISEFWVRWHISLSTWFRDYLYIPLGGNRSGKTKWIRNILIVFLISGFWHGANYTFIIWGALHAFYLIFARVTEKFRADFRIKVFGESASILKYWDVFITFNLVAFAWIFFRANSVSDSLIIIQKISSAIVHGLSSFKSIIGYLELKHKLIIICFAASYLFERRINLLTNSSQNFYNRVFFVVLLMLVVLLGKSTQEQFIYFQF